MARQKITLEFLARMMKRGFDDMRSEFLGEAGAIRTELRTETGKIRKDISDLKEDISELKTEVEEINERLEKYYSPELEKHGTRIKALEVHTKIHSGR